MTKLVIPGDLKISCFDEVLQVKLSTISPSLPIIRSKYTWLKKVFMLKDFLLKVYIFAIPAVKSLQLAIF